MSDHTVSSAFHVRLERLEKRSGSRNHWMAVFLLVNGFVLGAISSCTRNISNTIEAQKIILKDPSGHALLTLGVDNKWDGFESKVYYPGIEFQDEKGEKTMRLFGTGLSVGYGDENARLGFLGLEINNKETQIRLNPNLFSFDSKDGTATLFTHPTGMNFTITGKGGNEVGFIADEDSGSVYAASPKWEIDVTADKTGSRLVRGRKQ